MIGQQLGSFRIEGKIGAGAMGEVWRATFTDKSGERRSAAVKVISSDFALRDTALKRFQREAETLRKLRHKNIVRYYAHGKYQGTNYYAMEFIEGITLDKYLQRREFLPWREAVELVRQLCEALQYAHGFNVVHRDLKPSNLMLQPDGTLKLTDFGIVKDLQAEEDLTKTGRTLGTAAYMAPEQIRGDVAISHKTDLYAVGCLLYEVLTGQPPFMGKSAVELMHMHMSAEPPRPSSKNPDVPRALDDLVIQLMAKSRDDRPWDAQRVSEQLAELGAKADRGDNVPMAFDRARAKLAAAAATEPGRAATGSGTNRAVRRPKGTVAAPDRGDARRRLLEVVGLVSVLVALLGVLAYVFWPPGQEYLYRRAAALMESTRRGDWRKADREFLEPLDRRFPDHPYQEEVRAWRDRLAYEDAKERSKALAGTGLGSDPKGEAETLYQAMHRRLQPMIILEQHGLIKREYDAFARELAARDAAEERGWRQLADRLAADQERVLTLARDAAATEVEQAERLLKRGNAVAAAARMQQLLTRARPAAEGDRRFTELMGEAEDLLGRARSAEGAAPGADP